MFRHILFHGLVILFILLLAISPLLATMAAGTIANRYDCNLDEGSIHPCVVNGNDIGDTLYTLGMIAIAVYLFGIAIFYLVRYLIRKDRAKPVAGIADPRT